MTKIEKYLRKFKYEDERISNLLAINDDYVRFVRDYAGQFDMDDGEDAAMLSGYRNTSFGILFTLLHLGHITTADFHHRMHAMNLVYMKKSG